MTVNALELFSLESKEQELCNAPFQNFKVAPFGTSKQTFIIQ